MAEFKTDLLSPKIQEMIYKIGGKTARRLIYYCPGCRFTHQVAIAPSAIGPVWGYNEDPEAPTLTPSARFDRGTGRLCHHYVRNGRLQFLPDCDHYLAGHTVAMQDIPEDWL